MAGQIQSLFWNEKLKYLKWKPVTLAKQIEYTFRQLCGKVILVGMHPIGQIMNYHEMREFQNWGTEHIHSPIHVIDAPSLYKDDEVVIYDESFIDKYKSRSMLSEKAHAELISFVKEVQNHFHSTFCKKKKEFTCWFNAPWPPSDRTFIVHGGIDTDKDLLIEIKKVLFRLHTLIIWKT